MENNNNNKKSFFQKLFSNNGSVALSFVLAIVGIASILSFGFGQISFAAPVSSDLKAPFVTKVPDLTTDKVIGTTSKFPVTAFYTTDGIPVFCLEYNVLFKGGSSYQDGGEITDYGLLYLTANLYPNKKLTDKNGTELDKRAQAWITQTAIWIYLNKAGDAGNTGLAADAVTKIMNETGIYEASGAGDTIYTAPAGKTIYQAFGVDTLINTALNNRNKPVKNFNVDKTSDAISLTTDGKFYQTDAFVVTGSVDPVVLGSYKGYSLTLKDAPAGTIVVDEEGKQFESLENLPAGTKFYIRIPKDKVTEEKSTISITANGLFTTYEGRRFTSVGDQTITNVNMKDTVVSDGVSFEIVGTPDTGMNTAQSIYFIGLIVLLSGVGIIYANVKPAKNN